MVLGGRPPVRRERSKVIKGRDAVMQEKKPGFARLLFACAAYRSEKAATREE
jgi:hypothetical protein